MALNLLLVWEFKHAGLALATSLSAFLNAGLLLKGLLRTDVLVFQPGWWRFSTQVLIANSVMCVVLFLLVPEQSTWLVMAFWERLGVTLLICVAGAGTYGAALRLLGFNFKQLIR
jgi:putative peptidoglycan lipid II flippase